MSQKPPDPVFMFRIAFLGVSIAFVVFLVILMWRLSPVSLNSRLSDLEKRVKVLEQVR